MAFFLNHHIIAILVGTNHPDVNFIIFYDLEEKKPVGFTSFSSIKYNPIAGTMDFGQRVPNSIARTTREEDIKVTTVPLFIGKNLNPQFQEIPSFIQAQQ